jgi:ligand-binding sensor domain-containing protein
MNTIFFKAQTFTFLAILVFFTSCNGQLKTTTTDSLNELEPISVGKTKLIKTQDSHENDNVRCGLQDKAGNLWFGTTGDGLYRYDGKLFFNYTVKDGLNSNTVWSILEDKEGNIWIGTDYGVCLYDGKSFAKISLTNEISLYPSKSNNKNDVWCMMQDKKGIIWFGTYDNVYNYDGTSFNRFLDNDSIINKDNIKLTGVQCIYEDKNGNIWFGSGMPPGSEGVCHYDGKNLTHSKPNGDSWIRYIIEDNDGKIWFGGRNHGNFYYDGKTFTIFTEKIEIGNSILSDKSGKIWFTGAEGDNSYESKDGIWCYNGKTFTNYFTKEGMSKNFVHCIIEDRDGNIWIGTRKTGLYKFDGKIFTNYTE